MQCLFNRSDGDDSLLSSGSEVSWGEGVSLPAADGETCLVCHVWFKCVWFYTFEHI